MCVKRWDDSIQNEAIYSDPFLNTNLNTTSFFVPLTTTFSTKAVNTAGSNSRHSSCPASMRMNSDIRFARYSLSSFSRWIAAILAASFSY